MTFPSVPPPPPRASPQKSTARNGIVLMLLVMGSIASAFSGVWGLFSVQTAHRISEPCHGYFNNGDLERCQQAQRAERMRAQRASQPNSQESLKQYGLLAIGALLLAAASQKKEAEPSLFYFGAGTYGLLAGIYVVLLLNPSSSRTSAATLARPRQLHAVITVRTTRTQTLAYG